MVTWQHISYNLPPWHLHDFLLTLRWHTEINIDFSSVSANLSLVHLEMGEMAGDHLLQTGFGWRQSSLFHASYPCPGSSVSALGAVCLPRHTLLLAVIEAQEHKLSLTNNFQASAYIMTDDKVFIKASCMNKSRFKGLKNLLILLWGTPA